MRSMTGVEQDTARDWFCDELAGVATAAPTDGTQPLMLERSARAGQMAPLHRRDQREVYRVLEGEVTFHIGGESITAAAGDVVVAPAGAPRTFLCDSSSARWLVVTRVRSVERFHDFGRAVTAAVSAPAAGWPSARDEATVGSIAAANGIELLGPPGSLPA